MKKLLIALLTLVLCFTAFGCNQKTDDNKKLKVINIELTAETYAFAIAKENTELKEKVNTWLNDIMENGHLEEVINSFFDGTTEFTYTNPASKEGCLVVATNAYFPPFEYYEGNKLTGIDIQLAYELAQYLGKNLYVEDMDFEAIINSVKIGNCDIGMAGLTVNEERLESVDFSVGYYESAQVMIVKETCTDFDSCQTADDVLAVLATKDTSYEIGAQNGTTGYMFSAGDSGFGYDGITNVTTLGFTSGALAALDVKNGKIDAVIIDLQPALAIVENLNA